MCPRHDIRAIFIAAVVLTLLSCCTGRVRASYAVVPASPAYLVRSPDGVKTPFPALLSRYGNFVPGQGWIDLRPEMELGVENAYYRAGFPKRGLEGFLGTEIARYEFRPGGGLHLLSVQSMKDRPSDQAPVQQFIDAAQRHHREYRLFFEVMFRASVQTRGSVLIGGESDQELNRLTNVLLADPGSFCTAHTNNCTVFPTACSVTVELPIYVNGERRLVPWSSTLASVLNDHSPFALRRVHDGKLIPVKIDPGDRDALAVPLLPGDHIDIN